MDKKQQQQVAMGIVAAGLFGYVYYAKLLTPVQAAIVQKQSDLAEVNGRIDSLRVTANQRDQLLKRVAELQAEVVKVERRLPRTRNVQDIIKIVSELATKSGIRYSSFSPMGESSQQYFTEIPFGMNITGNVQTIGKFLAAIGQQERIFSVKNLSLSYASDPKKNQTVSGSFTLYAFIYNG